MRALIVNGTLKASPAPSSTEALSRFVAACLNEHDVETDHLRLADHAIPPGVESEAQSDDDAWPEIRTRILAADIVVFATPTWLGQPSSVIKRALERMDAMISETDDDGVPVLFNTVAGCLVVGNEDGAHHCISEISGALIDLGCTIPGQSWTYWNKGPGPGQEVYLTTEDREWTHETGRAMAHVLVHTARALAAHPIPKPPNA